MIAYLDRDIYTRKGTGGKLSFKDQAFYTVERPWLSNQRNISCIPEGVYIVKKYTSERFQDVWEVQDVEGRTYNLFHAGNKPSDVEGCIAVGLMRGNQSPLWVEQSKKALDKMREVLPDEFVLVVRAFSTKDHNSV